MRGSIRSKEKRGLVEVRSIPDVFMGLWGVVAHFGRMSSGDVWESGVISECGFQGHLHKLPIQMNGSFVILK